MKGQSFNELIEKYLDESIQADEMRDLAAMLKDPSYTSELDRIVLNSLENRATGFELDHDTKTAIREYLQKQTQVQQAVAPATARVHFFRKWRWAAAVLFAVGAVALAIVASSDRQSNRSEADLSKNIPHDIPPGGEKAILTLVDGSTIVLDSAADGTLAQQGNTSIVKLANGEISYRPVGAVAGEVMMNTMTIPRGGQYRLTLPDGSKVWLNATSSITYPAAFSGSQRKVRVQGEAYFEITKNKEKPFVVDVNGQSIVEVLGTHFNINSYPDENSIKTTLVEGSVKVSTDKNDSVVLKPGQQAEISGNSVIINRNIEVESEIAWKDGLFIFNKDDIKSVMRQISRWYDVEVTYDNPALNERYVAEISRNLPISKVLRFLELTNGVHFKIDGKHIIVTK